MINSIKSFSSWIIIGVIAALMPLVFDSYFALTLLSNLNKDDDTNRFDICLEIGTKSKQSAASKSRKPKYK